MQVPPSKHDILRWQWYKGTDLYLAFGGSRVHIEALVVSTRVARIARTRRLLLSRLLLPLLLLLLPLPLPVALPLILALLLLLRRLLTKHPTNKVL